MPLCMITLDLGFQSGTAVKNLLANARDAETWVRSLGWEDLLEWEMAPHSSVLAWKIPWTEEPCVPTVHGAVKSWTRLRDWTELSWACSHASISWLSFIVSHSITWCPEWQLVPQKGLDTHHVMTWEVCSPQTCFIVGGGERPWCSPEARRVQTSALDKRRSYLFSGWFHCYFQGSKRGFSKFTSRGFVELLIACPLFFAGENVRLLNSHLYWK